MYSIALKWGLFRSRIDADRGTIKYGDTQGNYYLYYDTQDTYYVCVLDKMDADDFELNYKKSSIELT